MERKVIKYKLMSWFQTLAEIGMQSQQELHSCFFSCHKNTNTLTQLVYTNTN